MIIALAQVNAVKGNIERNADTHEQLITEAVTHQARLIVFPELSLSGYEPTLAADVAVESQHPVFERFRRLSDANRIAIASGVPLKTKTGVNIAMPIFRPGLPPLIYSKEYLHDDELPFFIAGESISVVAVEELQIAFAICYEISVEEHEAKAFKTFPDVYIASVVKSTKGTPHALDRLSKLAQTYHVPVLMVNSVGESDGFVCGGRSSGWTSTGTVAGQLSETETGMLFFDTVSGQCFVHSRETKRP